jgi:uncharacterized protein
VYLAVAFAVTWSAWLALALMTRAGLLTYGEPAFMAIYILGGFGPAIGAYVSIWLTRSQAPFSEYHRRLFKWRVPILWYLFAVAVPLCTAFLAIGIVTFIAPNLRGALDVQPWYRFFPLFAMMLIGGGVEELGWRGVAQPEISRRIGPAAAALCVGVVWALWHLPLFYIAGVSQYQGNFPRFALGVVGAALILGWVYSRTQSILLCILLHATSNAVTALGLAVASNQPALMLLGPCLNVLLGGALLIADRVRARVLIAARYK